jgi:hypothetical protein
VAQKRRQQRGDEQNDDQDILELLKQDVPGRYVRRGLQFVQAVLL